MVFLFFVIFIIFFLGLVFSKIEMQIIDLRFCSSINKHINKNYKIIIKLFLFDVIPLIKITVTQNKLEKMKVNQKAKSMALKAVRKKKSFNKIILSYIEKINITIKRINLKLEIGTENAAFTAIAVGLISPIVGIILGKKVEDYKNQTFIIKPIYTNQNFINIAVSGIFEIKLIHIINIIYILTKKEGVKRDERASNRRAYDYSYE